MNFSAVRLRAVEIALSDACAADVQLAGNAEGDRLQIPVQDIDIRVGDGPADRNYGILCRNEQLFRIHLAGSATRRWFRSGRTGSRTEAPLSSNCRAELSGQGFTAAEDLELIAPLPPGVQQKPPGGWGRLHDRGAVT